MQEEKRQNELEKSRGKRKLRGKKKDRLMMMKYTNKRW